MIAEGDRVAARRAMDGTHRGRTFGVSPTGRKVKFSASAIAHIKDGKIAEAWSNID